MSSAEHPVLPPPPTLPRAIGSGAVGLYLNSWRFLAVNLLFGLVAVAVYSAFSVTPIGALGILLLVPIAAGIMRMANRYVRHGSAEFADFLLGARRRLWQNLGLALAQLALMTIAVADVFIGLRMENVVGPVLAVASAYGFIAIWVVAVTTWPLVLDPQRDGEPLRAKLRTGAVLPLVNPLGVIPLAALIGAFLVLSTILVAAVLTFGVALAWLVAAHYVLPLADRWEGRAAFETED